MVTNGILKSIKERDRIHKLYAKELDEIKKIELHNIYKSKRNLITSLIRKSKSDYYVAYFEENKTDSKKTWEGIRNIVNVSKRVRVVPNFVEYKGKVYFDTKDIAGSFNDFFVNIGNTVEEKIPKVKSHFSSYLQKANVNSLLLMPVDNI